MFTKTDSVILHSTIEDVYNFMRQSKNRLRLVNRKPNQESA